MARIAVAVAQAEGGLPLEDLARRLDPPIPRRTLVRRLNDMVGDGRLLKTGVSRAARYHRPATVAASPTAEPSEVDDRPPRATAERPGSTATQVLVPTDDGPAIPLTHPARELAAHVSRPIARRRPVGYERAFLDAYRPNRTSYLTADDRRALHRLGQTTLGAAEAGTYAQHILNRLLIDLAWNSSRLEGNTYSLLDTQRLIELGEAAEGKNAGDAQMIANHKRAIEFLVQSAGEIGFDRMTLLNLHALLSENLLADPTSEGRLRAIPVGIGGSVYHPLGVPQAIAECFDIVVAKAAAIEDPFEQALFAMVQLPYLQPFDDVNKRVSRLAANIPLVRGNLAPLSFVDVPAGLYTKAMLGIYELNRIELLKDVFLWAYERSAARYAAIQRSIGAPDPFRLAHRAALKQVIGEVVRGGMEQGAAARHIEAFAAARVEPTAHGRFVEVAETELLALHEGNFARYELRPSEFRQWQIVWTRRSPAA